ncbi:Gfo/Idh/MocA family protein [Jiulongibacter sp. NS-SX5]|uniref:Gfo/Idh/MocA family protein n=1 Tax=Jiulongibacter sp. NS-SX5 TaxID=3463854 RepID=UPI004059F701
MTKRRDFIKTSAMGLAGMAISAKSYSRILGANDRINMVTAGVNGRGRAHLNMARGLKKQINVIGLVDPDSRVFARCFKDFKEILDSSTLTMADYRKALDNKDVDAISIAAPDHWHAPMAIEAMKADKHVYLEKPCCHNAAEGDLLHAAVKKYGKVLQVGNQQRSSPTTASLKRKLDEGIIGKVYYARTWYENNRGSIGTGQKMAAPAEFNWELWQGPAPRTDLMDNYVHYNWHWFWDWGTGEISNNGLHELDVARWLLNAGIPSKVTSTGGRYSFNDDWQFWDTQIASFEYDDDLMITWDGRSCNGTNINKGHGGRGTWIHGTHGTAVVDRGGYKIFDKGDQLLVEENERSSSSSVDTLGITGLDYYHMQNFVDGINKGAALNSPIDEAVKSTLMCHLGNMAQKTGQTLLVDTKTGKPANADAMKMWGRSYEKGWEPKV